MISLLCRHLTFVARDGMHCILNELNRLVLEKYLKVSISCIRKLSQKSYRNYRSYYCTEIITMNTGTSTGTTNTTSTNLLSFWKVVIESRVGNPDTRQNKHINTGT